MKKLLALLLAVMMIAGVFAGCGQPTNTPTETPDATQTEQPSTPEETPAPTEAPATTGPDGREFADEQVYRTLYSSEVTTMNYLKSGTTYELVVGANTIDSLVENDPFGNIVPCAAESWEVSEDGLTWTFHLRQGQYWYDADGNQKDPVTAHDYVAAARYVCDANNACDNSYLMEGWLVNAEEAVYYTAYAAAAIPKGTEKGKDQDAVIDENGIIYEGKSWKGDDETGAYTEWVEVPVVTPDQVGASVAASVSDAAVVSDAGASVTASVCPLSLLSPRRSDTNLTAKNAITRTMMIARPSKIYLRLSESHSLKSSTVHTSIRCCFAEKPVKSKIPAKSCTSGCLTRCLRK